VNRKRGLFLGLFASFGAWAGWSGAQGKAILRGPGEGGVAPPGPFPLPHSSGYLLSFAVLRSLAISEPGF
jgi:hypothetical protein